MGKTIAQTLIEEGKEIGAVTAKQEDLIELLRGRFTSFPQALIGKIKSIHEIEQLNALFSFAVTAETINEVESKIAEISTES